jgi:hypothetical protein
MLALVGGIVGMNLLAYIESWLSFGGPPMSALECVVVVLILAVAAMVFNIVTNTCEPTRMICNFFSLLGGAALGGTLFPHALLSIDPAVTFVVALFSGMTVAGLINMVLLKSD